MRTPRRFTLVELLVVISVIFLLASLLLPALGRAKGVVRSTACKSNLKQMGLAYSMYRGDYNDWCLPPWRGATQRWYGLMLSECKYIPSSKVFLCPAETKTRLQDTEMSYGMNGDFGLDTGSASRPLSKGGAVSRFNNDSNLLVIADSPPVVHTGAYSSELISIWGKVYPFTTGGNYPVFARHMNRANAVLFDGHVQDFSHNDLDWTSNKIHWWPSYAWYDGPPLRKF